jgi:hypothetical protein
LQKASFQRCVFLGHKFVVMAMVAVLRTINWFMFYGSRSRELHAPDGIFDPNQRPYPAWLNHVMRPSCQPQSLWHRNHQMVHDARDQLGATDALEWGGSDSLLHPVPQVAKVRKVRRSYMGVNPSNPKSPAKIVSELCTTQHKHTQFNMWRLFFVDRSIDLYYYILLCLLYHFRF